MLLTFRLCASGRKGGGACDAGSMASGTHHQIVFAFAAAAAAAAATAAAAAAAVERWLRRGRVDGGGSGDGGSGGDSGGGGRRRAQQRPERHKASLKPLHEPQPSQPLADEDHLDARPHAVWPRPQKHLLHHISDCVEDETMRRANHSADPLGTVERPHVLTPRGRELFGFGFGFG